MSNALRVLLFAVLVVAEACLLWLPPAPRPTSPPGPHSPTATPTPTPPHRFDPKEMARKRFVRLSSEAEKLRHRTFLRPVPSTDTTREELRGYLEREMDKDTNWSAEEARLEEFGFIPHGYGLRRHLLDFYTSQVLGYYDPDTGSYHMVTAGPKTIGSRAMDLGWDLIQPGARIEQEEIAMVHELDHALTDQHFNLKAAQQKARKLANTDIWMAVQSLIEGDATMIMFHAQDQRMGIDPAYTRLDPSMMDTLQWLQGYIGGAEFNSFPLYFQRIALFPYLYGGVFVDTYRSEEGWPTVDRMYTRLPASTEQILHPAKYLYAVDPPIIVKWQGPSAAAPAGWRAVATDSMGELQIRLLFENQGFSKAEASGWASDWGGDSFRIFEQPGHPTGRYLVWVSTWDTEAAARRFFAGLSTLAAKRRGKDAQGRGYRPEFSGTPLRWSASLPGGRVVRIERWGSRVVYLQNVPGPLVPRCLTMARQATAAPLRDPGFAVGPEQ